MTVSNSGSCEPSAPSTSHKPAPKVASLPPPAVGKKKRNLPGMPDPDAEVIALSPRTLMATNRFVCEICNKGFQRDQNLQLHRRGHNLPWKLRQRTNKDVKKRVYVCPEPSCVHHDSSRALGDLTGIKKHFCRKHGEKKWKCDKCSKKYAVQSDWKAHYKTCGSREYRCDCGTLFSRRDSFITHRAFCDALAEESAKVMQQSTSCLIPAVSGTSEEDPMVMVPSPPPILQAPPAESEKKHQNELESDIIAPPPAHTTTASLFASLFSSSSAEATQSPASTFADLMGAMSTNSQHSGFITLPTTSQMFDRGAGGSSTLAPTSGGYVSVLNPPPPSPHMSATALLQKAAQMGAAATNSSSLRGFGLSTSSTIDNQERSEEEEFHENYQWRSQLHPHGLDLGLPYNSIGGIGCGGGLPELSSLCVAKPATLDFLGLGMVGPESSGDGLSALWSSIDVVSAGGGVGRFGSGGSSSVSMSINGNGTRNGGNESNNRMKRRL